jgi:hypothetical protein
MIQQMRKHIVHECAPCGAVYSDSIMQRHQMSGKGAACLFCDGQTSHSYPVRFKRIHDDLCNRGVTVDAIFFEVNGISNPRLVIRLSDNFVNLTDAHMAERPDAKPPDGFQIIHTRDAGECPVELVCYFDVTVTDTRERFCHNVGVKVQELSAWVNGYPYWTR